MKQITIITIISLIPIYVAQASVVPAECAYIYSVFYSTAVFVTGAIMMSVGLIIGLIIGRRSLNYSKDKKIYEK